MRSDHHVSRYSNLEVKYIDHHNPDLILLDEQGGELHRIDLTRLSSTASMHKLMLLLGLQEVCQDSTTACTAWMESGECARNPVYMNQACRRACGQCSEGAHMAEPGCSDAAGRRDCEYWSTMGECTSNPSYMSEQCARSCGFCTVSQPAVNEMDDEDEMKDEL